MERIIARIRQLLAYNLSVNEVHDLVVGGDCDESMFYLCFVAAQILDS